MVFPIVIHKERDSAYGVTVPDLPGCISAGDTLEEAIGMAREAIELHLEGMIEDGQALPTPKPLEIHRKRHADAVAFALVEIDAANLRTKVVRINITLPERILYRLDRTAKKQGRTRSGLLSTAVSEYIAAHGM
ncbi:MAG: type II toxin-antitoxin system HicB family antitoxin [Tepidisphaeraceae bacterium]|jgi:predicted RNase H-like HicB family nuclease